MPVHPFHILCTGLPLSLIHICTLAIYHIGVTGGTVLFTASDLKQYGSASGQDFYRLNLSGGRCEMLLAHELVPGTSPITDSTYGGGSGFVCGQGAAHYIVPVSYTHLAGIRLLGLFFYT